MGQPTHTDRSAGRSLGLIIQGPLVTYGQGPNNTPTGFDTLGSIEANVQNATDRGIPYCICTWEPQTPVERAIFDRLNEQGYKVLAIPTPSTPDPDHRYKHHYAIRKALDALDTPYLAKIRTDMVMPDSFWDWIANHLDERLTVSELLMPFYLGDFIYAGQKETVQGFLDAFLAHGSATLHPSITTDIGFKYFEAVSGHRISEYGMLLLYTLWRARTMEQWNQFVARYISVIPEHVFRHIVWRGRKIEDFINISAFKFTTEPPYPTLDRQFLLDEYLRFYAKRNDWRRFVVKLGLRINHLATRIERVPRKLARLLQLNKK